MEGCAITPQAQLASLGFEVVHSTPCNVVSWGKWFVGVKHSSGRYVAGYGEDEEAAFADALATVTKPADIAPVNTRH